MGGVVPYLLSGGVLGALAAIWIGSASHEARALWLQRLTFTRARRARGALAEAADEEEAFDRDRVEGAVTGLLDSVGEYWRRGPRPESPVVAAWAEQISLWFGSGLRLDGKPRIDVLQVINRPDEDEDRVALRVRVRVHRDHVPSVGDPHTHKSDTRWTLGRAGKEWRLLAIDDRVTADAARHTQLIPTASADTQRLTEQSLSEIARNDPPAGATVAGLVDESLPAQRQLLELSALDGRFTPALLEATLRHLLDAWEQATLGSQAPLQQCATDGTIAELLHTRHAHTPNRIVARDITLNRWSATQLDTSIDPPTVSVELDLSAVRYSIDDMGAIVGSTEHQNPTPMRWTLELISDGPTQWRLTHSSDPLAAIDD